MLHGILQRFVELVLRRDIEYSEFQGALIAFSWGLWMMNPWVDIFSTYNGYRALADIAPDFYWGILLTLVGVCQLYGLVRRKYSYRRFFAFMAAVIWTFIAVLLALTSPFFLSVPTAFMFAVGAAWGYLRIGMSRESNTDATGEPQR